MSQLVWSDDLNTGINVIDSQHRRIVDYINQLYEASTGSDPRAIAETIEDLLDYTLSHFAFEESLLEEVGYRSLPGHRKTHELFANKIRSFKTRFAAGENVIDEMQSLLRYWLFSHIRADDAAYVAAVKASLMEVVQDEREEGWLMRTLKRIFG